MKHYLSARQVAELAELMEDAPRRVGLVDAVLQAAAEGRGMTLVLADERGTQAPSLPSGEPKRPASAQQPRREGSGPRRGVDVTTSEPTR
jgi:hypothetical protein